MLIDMYTYKNSHLRQILYNYIYLVFFMWALITNMSPILRTDARIELRSISIKYLAPVIFSFFNVRNSFHFTLVYKIENK